jgi:hypothetical protein
MLNRAAALTAALGLTATLTFAGCSSRESTPVASLEPLTPSVTVTPAPTLSTTATPTPRDPSTTEQIERALRAAGQLLDVAIEPDCPQGADCIREGTVGASVEQGIMQLAYAGADGSGAALVMALDQDGAWAVWLASQRDVYQLLNLPGQLRVCGGGEGAELREAPSHEAASIATANDGDLLDAESFVLTEAGSLEKWGAGWYRVTSPVEAWAYSRDVAAAASGDCSLRDVYEKGEEPRG